MINKHNLGINKALVRNPLENITDYCLEYYNSKYQFSDFAGTDFLANRDQLKKGPFLLKAKKGRLYRYNETGLEEAYRHLISLYYDLDTCLDRLKDGYFDSCFIRFANRAGIFKSEDHWENLLRNWKMAITYATIRYYNACHNKYDPTTGLSYVAYFDTHFSSYLYFALGYSDQKQKAAAYNSKELEMLHYQHSGTLNVSYQPFL